jgi:hypothetical protein
LHKSSDYDVFRDGENATELSRRSLKFELATKAAYQATVKPPTRDVYAAFNVWLPGTSEIKMEPPQQLQFTEHLCEPDNFRGYPVGCNITPCGWFTDLHQGKFCRPHLELWLKIVDLCRRSLAKTFGKCEKVWLLFPSNDHNLKLFVRSAGLRNRLALIGSKLQGGIIAKVKSTHALELPAGTLHAVFTTVGGVLGGINYSTAESLPVMSRVLKMHLLSPVSKDHIHEGLAAYVETLSSTLKFRLHSVLHDALRSWIELKSALQELLDSGKASKECWKYATALKTALGVFGLEVRHAHRCGCSQYVDDIGTHVALVHTLKLA